MRILKKTASLCLCLLAFQLVTAFSKSENKSENKNNSKADKSVLKKKVDDLLKSMTIEEKVAQMQCYPLDELLIGSELDTAKINNLAKHGIGQLRDAFKLSPRKSVQVHNKIQAYLKENTRLGIPAIIHGEGLHGYTGTEATSFPQALALSSSWDLELLDKVYSTIATETRSRGVQQLLTPVLDIARDPRWGRFSETFGEDPYLSSEVGKAVVKSFQGLNEQFLDDSHVISTLKHFPAHGSSLGGFNCAPAIISENELRNVQMAPFKSCIEAGASSVMAMYGEFNGVPVHASEYILRDVLREELGFKGFVVSDYAAIELLATGPQWEFNRHHVAADSAEAGLLGVKAGVNIELIKSFGYGYLLQLVEENKISEKEIDALVAPMLEHKLALGLFDDPFVDENKAIKITKDKASDQLALEAAKKSIVMLKNANNTAPLNKKEIKSIAIIGPNANRQLLGDYSTEKPKYFVTVLDGIKNSISKSTAVTYHEGCKITPEIPENAEQLNVDGNTIKEAIAVAKKADVIVIAAGGDRNTAREGRDRSNLDLVGLQEELILELSKIGKPTILCLIGGIPYAIPEVYDQVDVIYQCWNLGQETGNAIAAVLFGEYNPSGKLTATIPKSVGHLPSYYNKKPTAYMRAYLYDQEAGGYCFPFGYGLSYSKFEYSNIQLSKTSLGLNDTLKIQIDIKNKGDMDGTEIIQLYIHDKVSSATRPMKELKDFSKVFVPAGASKTFELALPVSRLAFYNKDMEYVTEPGEFDIMIGSSSKDVDLTRLRIRVTD